MQESVCDRGGEAPAFRPLVAAVDGSECSIQALKTAVRLARSEGAELTILHVMVISLALYSGDVG